ncbi:MAG: hypothetical protein JW714_04345 [Candidatus Omnitrophica bacterium]|nr:hypothetical protein [Candidatus Omnitrophota bacterium]
MKKLKFLVVFILGLSFLGAATLKAWALEEDKSIVYKFWKKALPFDSRLDLGGFVKNETSVHLAGGLDEFMKMQTIMGLKTNYKITDNLELFTYYRWFWDTVYSIEENRYKDVSFEDVNRNLRMPDELQWLRECYFDIYTDRLDIRAGKQQVVWGTADGVRILDMVNPLDYREWTLKEYSETRMPLWMLNVEGELLMDGHLQFLVIPDYEANYYAPAGAPFTLRAVDLGAQSGSNPAYTTKTIDQRPSRQLNNSKIGLRWQNIIGGWDYTLNYLHTYDFASSAYTLFQRGSPSVLTVMRRSEQIDVYGASFSKTLTEGFLMDLLKGWTLRGEFAYVKDGAMNYGFDKTIVGTVDVDQYNYCLGFDKNFWTNWLFSYQFIQFIAHNTEDIPRVTTHPRYSLLFGPTRGSLDKVTTMMTLKLSTDFMHERLKPEILILYGFDNDWRISPKVSFEINDEWTVAGGLHIFEGPEQGLNGQFDKNDQLFVETTYNW